MDLANLPDSRIVSDMCAPPKYNWWMKLNFRKEATVESANEQQPQATYDVSEEKVAKNPLGLKLSTFHRTLRRNDDPAQVERLIRDHLASQRTMHDDANRTRKAAAIIKRVVASERYILVLALGRLPDLSFVRYGRIIKGRVKLGIFENTKPLRSLKRLLVTKGAKVLWEGKAQGRFSDFKVREYSEGCEDSAELFFYKSVMIKTVCPMV